MALLWSGKTLVQWDMLKALDSLVKSSILDMSSYTCPQKTLFMLDNIREE